MNSILKFIALAMCLSVAFSAATTGTFGTVVTNKKASASAVEYTNGWVVELTASGFIYGDAITAATAGTTTYTTLTKNTIPTTAGYTAVGLVGANCASGAFSATTTTLLGQNANAGCPADVITLYSAVPGTTPTSSIKPVAGTASTLLTLSAPVAWTITAPTTVGTGFADGVSVTNPASTGTATAVSAAAAVDTKGGAQQYLLSSISYAFYVETTNSDAVVCFQTATQYKAKAGDCGTLPTTSSAGILSATISGFVAMVALIFFN